jgi:hypothetical protein
MRKLKTAVVMGIGVAAIGGVGLTAANVSAWGGDRGYGGGSFTGGWNAYIGNAHDAQFDADVTAALAAKYDLQTDEVASVVEQVRDDQFNLLSEERLERLQQAVEDEKLTQEEYDYVVAKLESVDDMIDQIDDATGEERRELARDIRNELRSLADWMKEHDISVRLLAGASLGLEHHK